MFTARYELGFLTGSVGERHSIFRHGTDVSVGTQERLCLFKIMYTKYEYKSIIIIIIVIVRYISYVSRCLCEVCVERSRDYTV